MGTIQTMSDNETNPIEGKTIVDVRPMTNEEKQREGWSHYQHGQVPVLELSDGQLLYPSCDPEGNGPGALFGFYEETDTAFFVNP